MDKLFNHNFFKQTLNFFVVIIIAFTLLIGFSRVSALYQEGTGASLFEITREVQ